MNYKVTFWDDASRDALKLKREEPKSFDKLMKMVDELKVHPRSGTGKPEYLKYANVAFGQGESHKNIE